MTEVTNIKSLNHLKAHSKIINKTIQNKSITKGYMINKKEVVIFQAQM